MKRWLQWLAAGSLIVALPGLANSTAVAETGTLAGKVVVTKGKKDRSTVVYLEEVNGSFQPPQTPGVVDQKNKIFLPEFLAVQSGQTLRFRNHDPLTHNVHIYWSGRSMWNVSQAPNSHADWVPRRPGEYVILCNIHPEMAAAFLVLNNPFYAQVAAASSDFTIKDVPAGTYTLVAVQYVNGNFKKQKMQVTIKGGETTNLNLQL